ncbi:hypothetical protein JHL18_23585 [Clostridium sp. YIM B02505]|uniref:Uncharacterized protein n=1 Tax=Clostridium yunnanense TaxID=2800325 RepID=A0ABS1EWC6_9CLOT|nr:hypothetical protein [Clostridium yunnanense]MBK1813603.1 hypothetical protein [Clostridium yunnanense]
MIDISDQLSVKEIRISSHITKHPEGVLKDGNWYFTEAKNHEWQIHVEFDKVKINNYEFLCSTTIDNINLGEKEWTSFQNEIFDIDSQEQSEATFCVEEHHDVDYYEGSLTYVGKNIFNVFLKFDVMIKNFFEEPIMAKYKIQAEGYYNGLEIQISSIEHKPVSIDQIKECVGKCVNVELYEEPKIESQYLGTFKPKF